MNNINRPLVKLQAKQIIKGKVFQLFLISFVVSILAGLGGTGINLNINLNNYNNNNNSDGNGFYEYFDDFENGTEGNPIDQFSFNSNSSQVNATQLAVENNKLMSAGYPYVIFSSLAGLAAIAALIFIPLSVTLAGMYVSLVRRNANEQFEFGREFGGIFKNSFNDTYFKKLVSVILVELIYILLSILFIVPGVIFYFSSYFTMQIMCDYPNLKPSEAIKLSKKIVKGNRTELFTYELSFIPWYLLMGITFGLAGIYVIPYKSTANALYYENFRLRALAEGRITEDDFLSEQERIAKYSNVNTNEYQQNYYTNNDGAQGTSYQPYQQYAQNTVNNGTFYTPDFSPVQQNNPYAPNQAGGYYYNPQQQAEQPQQTYYQQPEQPTYYQPPEQAEQPPTYYSPTEPHQAPPQENTGEDNNSDNQY